MNSYVSPSHPLKYRLALLSVGCDVSASRKLCGFLGHSATMGCNKCMKQFEGIIGQKNYGGFNVREWVKRDKDSHMKKVKEIMKSKTKTKREELEKRYGVRYSVLLELEYFDPIRMTIIDPMHDLFLGTAKRMMTLWKDKQIFCLIILKKYKKRFRVYIVHQILESCLKNLHLAMVHSMLISGKTGQ